MRIPMTKRLIVRLADEGVPVRAICRALQTTFDEVWGVLAQAKEAGEIVGIPAADWPVGSRREDRAPTARMVSAADVDDLEVPLRQAYRLTGREARLIACLFVHRSIVAKPTLHGVLADDGLPDTDPKIVDVYICKIRAKGIGIETLWGRGYGLTDDSRKAIAEMLRQRGLAIRPQRMSAEVIHHAV